MMKTLITALSLTLALIEIARADPIKCVVNGKTIYTDDASICGNSTIKPITDHVSTIPKSSTSRKQPRSSPVLPLPVESGSDSLLQQFGMSQEDVANGWKTIMDAKERGSWKAPEMPDDAK
jgi:hypothetical protein